MTDRCRYVADKDIGRLFLPGCYGGALDGPQGCTCPGRRRDEPAEDEPTIEARLTAIEEKLDIILRKLTGGDA